MQLELVVLVVELVEVGALVVVVDGRILALVLVFQRMVQVFQRMVLVFLAMVLVQEEIVERVVLVVDSLELGLVEGKSEFVVVVEVVLQFVVVVEEWVVVVEGWVVGIDNYRAYCGLLEL
jgi:hypothetical protein